MITPTTPHISSALTFVIRSIASYDALDPRPSPPALHLLLTPPFPIQPVVAEVEVVEVEDETYNSICLSQFHLCLCYIPIRPHNPLEHLIRCLKRVLECHDCGSK